MTGVHAPRCLLTGAAGGLGRAIARTLHRRGIALHLVDLDADALRPLAEEFGATWTATDLTDPEAVPALFDEPPDYVVNAIGKGYFGTFDDLESDSFRRSFDVNFFAPLDVALEALRRWRATATPGRVLTLSSISGHKAYSTSVAYSVAKHALESAMRILRQLGAEFGIHVGTICPTNVDTTFWNAVEMVTPVELPRKADMISADDVAEQVVRWLEARRPSGVVFVPSNLGRRRTRYGRAPNRAATGAKAEPGVALVSGATAGLGRELVRRLRQRGWRIAAVARDANRMAAEFEADDQVLRCPGDVTDRDRMAAIVDETVNRFGAIDLLVNNAGSSWIGPALDMDFADVRRVFETNFFGYFHPTKAALPRLRDGGGTILNILSTTALEPAVSALPYSCAKIAQAALSDRLKDDLAPDGVRVVDLFPGNIRTEFFDRAESPEGPGVQVPANAMDVGEVVDAALELLDGASTTAIVPKSYGRRSPRQWVSRLLRP